MLRPAEQLMLLYQDYFTHIHIGFQMHRVCVGTDIIEIQRIREAVERWGDRFLNRVYTTSELTLFGGRIASLAARFAGKEAVIKALGGGEVGIGWKDVEILSEPDGKPVVSLSGTAGERAKQMGLQNLAISLSHSRENAIAIVIGIRED